MSTTPARLPAPELPAGPRSALVIATTKYDDPLLRQLRAPATDAVRLADVLADPRIGGFKVSTVVDRPAHEVRVTLEEFLAGRAPEELVVVYFSCHGVTNARRRLYFAATDTYSSRLASTGVDSVWVNDRLEECRARRQILILDCCFSGAFGRGAKGAEGLGLDQLTEPGRGRAVLTASNATEYSFETPVSGQVRSGTPAAGSVFTAALLAGLRDGSADLDGDGLVTVDEAYAYAYEQVRASGVAQTPQRWLSGGEGQLLFARNPSGRLLIPAALPASLRAALDSPWPNVRIGAIDELRNWLTSADPARVLTATRELQLVAAQDIPRVAAAAGSALVQPEPAGPATRIDGIDESMKLAGVPEPPAILPLEPAYVGPEAPEEADNGVLANEGVDRDLSRLSRRPVPPTAWGHGVRSALRITVVVAFVTAAVAALGFVIVALGQFPRQPDSNLSSSSSPSSRPSESTPSPAAGCAAIEDKFDSAELDSGWEQLNSEEFIVNRGALKVTANDGADVRGDMQGDITAPFLARRVQGDFSIETAVMVDPRHSYQGAGLLLYGDSENYVRLERGFGSEGAIAFEYAANGQHEKVHGPFSDDSNPVWTSATAVWLRLVRTDTSIKAFWHAGNTTDWQELSGTAQLNGDAKAGVAVLNRSQPPAGDPKRNPITASFSYVDVTC